MVCNGYNRPKEQPPVSEDCACLINNTSPLIIAKVGNVSDHLRNSPHSGNDARSNIRHELFVPCTLEYPTKMNDCSPNSSCATSVTQTNVTNSSCDDSFSLVPNHDVVMEESLEISAVDTHTSILNITEDDEEDGDEEGETSLYVGDSYLDTSVLFEEPIMDPDFDAHPCVVVAEDPDSSDTILCANATDQHNLSFVENWMEMFMVELCFPSVSVSLEPQESVEKYEREMSLLIDCVDSSTCSEMKYAQSVLNRILCTSALNKSSLYTENQRPRRSSKQQRSLRVKKLLSERGCSPQRLRGVRSMQDKHPSFCKHLDDGYDSDPDELLQSIKSPKNHCRSKRDLSPSSVINLYGSSDPQAWQESIHPVVQESLNSFWDLTWHKPVGSSTTPVRATMWMERGTLIKNNSAMIEPRLMFKTSADTYPHSIQLMQICRLIPCNGSLNRMKYPMARPSTSLMVRTTSQEHQSTNDFIFQATTASERDAIMHCWKVTVARFATLAVLEDVETLLKEFFVSTSDFPTPMRPIL